MGYFYPKVICHHITYEYGVPKNSELPPKISKAKIVGYSNLLPGIEALVVELDGKIHRPDGKIFHITKSLDPKIRKPVDSNLAIAKGYFVYHNDSFIEMELDPSLLIPTIING